MANKLEKDESFVTQSQWMEGMEMIKDFFGQLFNELRSFKNDQQETNKQIEGRLERIEGRLERTEAEVKLNTDSLGMLTQEIHKARNIEFEVFKQGQRIEKLEKAR